MSTASEGVSESPSPFMRLPLELRYEVYSHLVDVKLSPVLPQQCNCVPPLSLWYTCSAPTRLLQVARFVHDEVIDLLPRLRGFLPPTLICLTYLKHWEVYDAMIEALNAGREEELRYSERKEPNPAHQPEGKVESRIAELASQRMVSQLADLSGRAGRATPNFRLLDMFCRDHPINLGSSQQRHVHDFVTQMLSRLRLESTFEIVALFLGNIDPMTAKLCHNGACTLSQNWSSNVHHDNAISMQIKLWVFNSGTYQHFRHQYSERWWDELEQNGVMWEVVPEAEKRALPRLKDLTWPWPDSNVAPIPVAASYLRSFQPFNSHCS